MTGVRDPRPGAPGRGPRTHEYLSTLTPELAAFAAKLLPAATTDADDPISLKIAPEWVLDFFGIEDSVVREQTRFASTLLAMHTILQDKRIDGDFDASARSLSDLLSNLLLADSLLIFNEVAGHAVEFRAAVHSALNDLAAGYTAEPVLDAQLAADRDRYMTLVADRWATVKVLVSAVGYRDGRIELIPVLLDALRSLEFAQQLRDDLTDWRDDHARGRKTYVLLQLARLVGRPLGECEPDAIADALYLGGGLEQLIAELQELLRTAVTALAGFPRDAFVAHVRYLTDESQAIVDGATARKAAALAAKA